MYPQSIPSTGSEPVLSHVTPAAVVDLGTLALHRPASFVERQPTVDGPR